MGFTGYQLVFFGITGFYWVLLGLIGFDWVQLGIRWNCTLVCLGNGERLYCRWVTAGAFLRGPLKSATTTSPASSRATPSVSPRWWTASHIRRKWDAPATALCIASNISSSSLGKLWRRRVELGPWRALDRRVHPVGQPVPRRPAPGVRRPASARLRFRRGFVAVSLRFRPPLSFFPHHLIRSGLLDRLSTGFLYGLTRFYVVFTGFYRVFIEFCRLSLAWICICDALSSCCTGLWWVQRRITVIFPDFTGFYWVFTYHALSSWFTGFYLVLIGLT